MPRLFIKLNTANVWSENWTVPALDQLALHEILQFRANNAALGHPQY